jgi:hypothetical protein
MVAAAEAVEEAAEETSHPSARRRARRAPAAAHLSVPRAETVSAVNRPVVRAIPARVELNRRAALRKVPEPAARSSSASPEDH